MKTIWKKAAAAGISAAMMLSLGGCYSSMLGGSSSQNYVPKTTSPADQTTSLSVSQFWSESDQMYEFLDTDWGSTQEEFEKATGLTLGTLSPMGTIGTYTDLNHCYNILDHVSVSVMPVFDNDGGLSCVTISFENVYTAEQLESFYKDLLKACTEQFGEPERSSDTEEDAQSAGTFQCHTDFWYQLVSDTQKTSLQIGTVDKGNGVEGVVVGVNSYDPAEEEEETSEEAASDVDAVETDAASESTAE